MTREEPAEPVPEIDLERVVWDADYRRWALQALKGGVPEETGREPGSGGPADR
jgi:hypothetical protein